VAGLLYAATRALPSGSLDPTPGRPRYAARWYFLLGFAFYPILLLVPGLGDSASAWPPAVLALEAILAGLLFLYIRRVIGRTDNGAALTMLALGALVPLFAVGLFTQIFLPVVLVPDVLFVLFFYALWQRYRPAPATPPVAAT